MAAQSSAGGAGEGLPWYEWGAKKRPRWLDWMWPAIFGLRALRFVGGPEVPFTWWLIAAAVVAELSFWGWSRMR